MSLLLKITLGGAGLTALGIGLAITFVPLGFYAGYGIVLGTDPALLSELRAPGASLAAFGAAILAGAVRPEFARVSAALGALVFLAFAFGRMVGIALDGWPGESILAALAVELVFGGLCLFLLHQQRGAPTRPATLLGTG